MTETTVTKTSARAVTKLTQEGLLFSRAQAFHTMLMEDFRFLEAARMYSGGYDPPRLNYTDVSTPENFREAALAYPNGLINFDHFTHCYPYRVFKRLRMVPDNRSLHFLTRRSRWPSLQLFSGWALQSEFFRVLMVVIIITNSLTIAADQELGQGEFDSKVRDVLETFDFFFLLLFIAEICFKWADDFGAFWTEGWNIFDFLITYTSLVGPALDVIYPETDEEEELENILNAIKYLRIFRIFRSLNVVTRAPKIQQIWAAVLKTFTAMIFIVSLMGFFFYIFAIVGLYAFDRYTKSHKKFLEYRNAFQDLPNAFVTLFQLFTLDHWFNLLTESSETMERFAIPCVFILMWILLGSFIFRNIFVGVMVNNFQNIRMQMFAEKVNEGHASKMRTQLDIFTMDELEREHISSNDALVDWEAEIFHNLEIIKALGEEMSPLMWPRDTMYQYYMLLEAYASNMDERNYIMKQLDKAMIRFFDM